MDAIIWSNFSTRPHTTVDSPETEIAERNALDAFTLARAFYDEMNWNASYDALVDARHWTEIILQSIRENTTPTSTSTPTPTPTPTPSNLLVPFVVGVSAAAVVVVVGVFVLRRRE